MVLWSNAMAMEIPIDFRTSSHSIGADLDE